MPQIANINLYPQTDATIQVQMVPQTAIGSWSITFQVTNRFGAVSGLITGSTASGYINNVSGLNIVNSGNGIFSAFISGGSTSGWDPDAYSYVFKRTGSGVATILAEGYLLFSY